jgi:hypothetical protein
MTNLGKKMTFFRISVAWGALRRRTEVLFVEKKNQKTFVCLVPRKLAQLYVRW